MQQPLSYILIHKQNEEIEQKKMEDSKRQKGNRQQQNLAASQSLNASQAQDKKESNQINSGKVKDEESGSQNQLLIGESSMSTKILKLAEELLDEINEFIENLWIGQSDTQKGDAQTDG